MSFGWSWDKLILIGLIAVLVVGPERLPAYAERLGKLVRWGRDWAKGARERLKDEMGDDFDDVEWRKLDPRQYDPRRIIREALLDDAPLPSGVGAQGARVSDAAAHATVASKASPAARLSLDGAPPPFDAEAT